MSMCYVFLSDCKYGTVGSFPYDVRCVPTTPYHDFVFFLLPRHRTLEFIIFTAKKDYVISSPFSKSMTVAVRVPTKERNESIIWYYYYTMLKTMNLN